MIDTRPTPTGHQHYLDVRLRHAPASRHTDPLAALDDMERGLQQPLVEVIERHANWGVVVRVSMFSDYPEGTPQQIAALKGVAAEIRFEDS